MFRSFFLSRQWLPWSFPGAALILFATWYKVELDVKINEWFGEFYNYHPEGTGPTKSHHYGGGFSGNWPRSAISRASM